MTTADSTPDPTGKRPALPEQAEVPDADAQEQGQPAEGWGSPDLADRGPAADASGVAGDRPEADAAEQAQVVADEQVRTGAPRGDDVAEADWLEQTIVEPIDDEER